MCTKRPFSAIAIDHTHEQNNKIVKGDGGAVGLLQNPRALLRWMVAGPELARVIEEFEINCLNRCSGNIDTSNLKHHEDTHSVQVTLENTELWVACGTGKHLRYIPAHAIATALGDEKARSLPMFHAFTGCDKVSSFAGRGKKTAFDIWKSFNEVTPVFLTLSTHPTSISEACMSVMESYVVLLYDRTCTAISVDSARKHIFSIKARSMDAIPPTAATLVQHTKRAVYQGGHVWGQAHVRNPELPSPETCGWRKSATK